MEKKIDFLKPEHETKSLRQCETHSQCVSLAPPREPLKLSLVHSIVFHIALSLKIGPKAKSGRSIKYQIEKLKISLYRARQGRHFLLIIYFNSIISFGNNLQK